MGEKGNGKDYSIEQILAPVKEYWGYDGLRPLQEEAIQAGLSSRDSLVVLPTGGGKSLCYQVPPVLAKRTDVVVSPLISLMKDQVDGLRSCGYPAGAIHSGMSPVAQRESEREIESGQFRLIFVSPERILTPRFMELIGKLNVRAFAIDEAHCISHWGHDFRPHYRQLAMLKERCPRASLHAYTATATKRVQDDIVKQLKLVEPVRLVGVFDRPNLVYRIVPRLNRMKQIVQVLKRHADEAVIIYAISRKDTEAIASTLQEKKYKAKAYHAGMSPEQRRKIQNAFASEKIDIVVATVAFGMGIDRSNVRCVIHAAMPKSVEHYQQEAGRAGRDGLEAECVMLYSVADAMKWESLMERSAREAEAPPEFIESQRILIGRLRKICSSAQCRHKMLSEYFGQAYERGSCTACDVCLEENESIADGTVTAQKILSCVYRVEQRFGVGHVVDVLHGAKSERISNLGHDELSTYGLLKEVEQKQLTNFVYQLVDQGLLTRTDGEMPVLRLNGASWEVLRGQRQVKLVQPKAKKVKKTRGELESWDGVDRTLFEHLRTVRMEIAKERGVPPFVVFGDRSLRDMARLKPTDDEEFRQVFGVGKQKAQRFGGRFVREIEAFVNAVKRKDQPEEKTGVKKVRRRR